MQPVTPSPAPFFSSFLIGMDKTLDVIPGASTINGVACLIFKALVIPFIPKNKLSNCHFLKHIASKSVGECFLSIIPIVGNIGVAILRVKEKNKNKIKEKEKEKEKEPIRCFAEKGTMTEPLELLTPKQVNDATPKKSDNLESLNLSPIPKREVHSPENVINLEDMLELDDLDNLSDENAHLTRARGRQRIKVRKRRRVHKSKQKLKILVEKPVKKEASPAPILPTDENIDVHNSGLGVSPCGIS